MNVKPIVMDRAEARRRWREYRTAQLREAADSVLKEEYRAMERGLSALRRGTPIIDLQAAMRSAGHHDSGFPRLAIARADRLIVVFHQSSGDTAGLFSANISRDGRATRERARSLHISVDLLRRPSRYLRGFAMVPTIPPQVRQEARGSLTRYFVLWEVEQWLEASQVRADRDPYLLRDLGGGLYAVIGHWDLTELERVVMQCVRGR